jgi:hypothetical protein
VGWALRAGGQEVARAVVDAFAQALAAPPAVASIDVSAADRDGFRAHGRLTPVELAGVVKAALSEVIAPCAKALLERAAV